MPGDNGSVPVTVLVPTVGRAELLTACLRSIQSCQPAADEILVVDQSGSEEVARLVEDIGAHLVRCAGRGIGKATNLGLRAASHETVLVTHDDCTVSDDWVGTARALAARRPDVLFTGRVLPGGEADAVPSTIEDPVPRDYTGDLQVGALYPANMVLPRATALELGGFDERFIFAAEDNDFCYRWLRAGHGLRYEPQLVVWHHDWRSPVEMERLYRGYYREQGMFYAKHLRARDPAVLRFLLSDLYRGVRGRAGALAHRRATWSDPRPRIRHGLLPGLLFGWRRFR